MRHLRPHLIAVVTLSSAYLGAATSSSTPVTIPPQYVYQPKLGSLNDYCTKSPDGDGALADFRGPCARHDLCIDHANHTWPNDAPRRKNHQLKVCNPRLEDDMWINCNAAYTPLDPRRHTCHGMAKVYHLAVTAYTVVKGGKKGVRALLAR